MALDALRSTFSFKKASVPAGPIAGWGQPSAPEAPASADEPLAAYGDATSTTAAATDAAPYPSATSSYPPAPAYREAAAPWDVPKTPWETPAAADDASPISDAGPTPVDDSPTTPDLADPVAPAAPEPYGLPVQPMAASTFEVPPVPASLLASAPAAPTAAAVEPTAAAPSSYAADQYAAVFADPIAGGGTDGKTFGCPTCGRTLDRGTFRCEDCRTFLVLGQPLRQVGPFILGGVVAGIVATILLVNLFAPAKPATVAGVDAATGGSGSGAGASALQIPTGAAAALRGTTAINGRLAAQAPALRKALGAKKFRTSDVQKVLRRMAVDTRAGSGMLPTLAAWPEAAGQQAALDGFYSDLQRQIDGGLNASLRSAGSYKKAAKAILATLERTPGLDADARMLAVSGGVDLPPVDFPNSLR